MTIQEIKKRINFRQPKYVLPAILYFPIIGTLYLVVDMFDTELADVDTSNLEKTEYINTKLPNANLKGDGIGGKYQNMQDAFGNIDDLSAVNSIEQGEEDEKEEYESKYTEEERLALEQEAARQAELAKMEAAGKGQGSEEQEALRELEKALAEARLKGMASVTGSISPEANTPIDSVSTPTTPTDAGPKDSMKQIDDDSPTEVVKKVPVASDYFNTIADNSGESNLIKAIIDENIKAVDGSRVRLRLLDDVEIGETSLRKGSYLYATLSGFSSQRVKGTVASVMVGDEILKINLSIYDTDGLEGLYVPSSSFRETGKDVASGAMSGSMNFSTTSTQNSLAQWGMTAAQNAYQKTSNAIAKAIRKNSVKLKYGTQVYLINSKSQKEK